MSLDGKLNNVTAPENYERNPPDGGKINACAQGRIARYDAKAAATLQARLRLLSEEVHS
jgi:hypothetical protein